MKVKRFALNFFNEDIQLYHQIGKVLKEQKKKGLRNDVFKTPFIVEAIKEKLKNEKEI